MILVRFDLTDFVGDEKEEKGDDDQEGISWKEKRCVHSNIVGHEGIFRWGDQLWIISEFMGGGTLSDIACSFDRLRLTESQISFVLLQVCFRSFLIFSSP